MKTTFSLAAIYLSFATPILAQDQTTLSDVTAVEQAQRSTCATLGSEAVKQACLDGVAATDVAMRAAVEALPVAVELEADEPETQTAAIWARFAAARDVCNTMEVDARSDCVLAATVARQNELNGTPAQTASIRNEPPAPYRTWTDTSAIDDSKSVFVVYASQNREVMRSYGNAQPLQMNLRCLENTTTLYFSHNEAFFADIQNYGRVTMRMDDDPAFNRNFVESTDNQALGRWNGGQSIPVIRAMFGKDLLTVRLTPYNESPRTFTFNIRGIEQAVSELRETCNW